MLTYTYNHVLRPFQRGKELQYFKTIRPLKGLFGSLLVVASFKTQTSQIGMHVLWIGLTVFVLISATMVWNDYVDRKIDVAKGKRYAYDNPSLYFYYGASLWAAAVFSSLILLRYSAGSFLLAIAMIVIGLTYSITRQLPLLSSFVVAATSASIVLFVPLQGFVSKPALLWQLFLAAFVAIACREVLKDLDDLPTDNSNKRTLPVLVGARKSKRVASVLLMLLIVIGLTLKQSAIVWVNCLLFAVASWRLWSDYSQGVSKLCIDTGIAIYLLSLTVSGV
jgi:4-hydroxybenzoate polyprenyltransferase